VGHPWPIVPRLASMPNAPLHSTYARPPDGTRGPRCLGELWKGERKAKAERKSQNKSITGKPAPTGSADIRWMDWLFVLPAISQTTLKAPSAGRVESLWKGASRMDAARGVKGHGRPLYAGPWSNDGAREPDEVGPDARGKTSWLLLGRLPEVTRRKGETQRSGVTAAGWPVGRAKRVNR